MDFISLKYLVQILALSFTSFVNLDKLFSLSEFPFLWWQNMYEITYHLVLLYGLSGLKYFWHDMERQTILI